MNTMLRATMVALLAGTVGIAGTDSPTAPQILAHAKAEAAAEHKNIFVLFESSW